MGLDRIIDDDEVGAAASQRTADAGGEILTLAGGLPVTGSPQAGVQTVSES